MNSLRQKSVISGEMDTGTFPAVEIRRDSPVASLFVLVFSGIVTGFALFFIVYSAVLRAFRAEILIFALPVIIIGTGIFILGLNMIMRRSTVIISPDNVTVQYSSLFTKNEWVEPLPDYEGIEHGIQYRGNREYHIITLHHKDAKKSVELALYRSDSISDAEVQEKQERYGFRLNLPLMKESRELPHGGDTSGTGEGRKESGRSISTPVKKNMKQVPEGLRLEVDGDVSILTILAKKSLSISTLFTASVAAVIMAAGFHNGFNPSSRIAVLGFFGVIIGVYVIIFVLFDLLTRQRIKVHAGVRVCIVRNTPLGDTKGTCFNTGDIRDIIVEKGPRNSVESLVVSGKESCHTGEGLKRDSLEWLKQYLEERL